MNAFTYVAQSVIPATYSLLPSMKSDEATGMLLAIGLQESRFKYRAQIGGPARGFWQFESGGGWRGVMNHSATRAQFQHVLTALGYQMTPSYEALATDDILACCCARLLLWTLPGKLPDRFQKEEGWRQYLSAWRPGKPHPETWDAFYAQAWEAINGQVDSHE